MKMKRGNRYEIIKSIVNGKNVLDVGCVDHDYEDSVKNKKDEWLHGFISRHAKSVTGIDTEKNEIRKIRNEGYRCLYGDAENIRLKKKFDVVIAGEIIEHLSNPGKFLDSVRRHLKKGGKLVLTTPNPYFFKYIIKVIFLGKAFLKEDHTCMYDPQTLSFLLKKHGFIVDDMYWINFSPKKYKLGYWISYWKQLNANFLVISEKVGKE